jgi:hypothetical protein
MAIVQEYRPQLSPEELRLHILKALGTGPETEPPGKAILIGETRKEGAVLQEFQYRNGMGETVGITVAEPAARRYTRPVVAVHQTNSMGRREVFGLEGDPELEYGLTLAQRGHRVFASDVFLTGDRTSGPQWAFEPFYVRHPLWSAMGKILRDLDELTQVMRRDFGEEGSRDLIGHSIGGVIGLFAAALGKGYTRIVCNAGYLSLAQGPDPWENQLYISQLLPRRKDAGCLGAHNDLLFSLAGLNCELMAMCYRSDTIIHHPVPDKEELRRMTAFSKPHIYALDGPHVFPANVRIAAYEFLETGQASLDGRIS